MPLLPGVYKAKKKDGTDYFRSSITWQSKHLSLGSYPTEEMAHAAYEEAKLLFLEHHIGINALHDAEFHLPFEKQIVLINFRDNKLYFKNPIYLKQNFFEYHLAPGCMFLFDIEDLFYYSSHKIMKRNGHLFVSDYGMQVNILARYGIKNYAVVNRDYFFVNKNPNDFRYENIVVVNRYNGVQKIEKQNITQYQTKIHVNGNILVGTYKTEEEAAIAYNKAIDYLFKLGIKKNYQTNYIATLSSSAYAEIYHHTKLSKKLKQVHSLL